MELKYRRIKEQENENLQSVVVAMKHKTKQKVFKITGFPGNRLFPQNGTYVCESPGISLSVLVQFST